MAFPTSEKELRSLLDNMKAQGAPQQEIKTVIDTYLSRQKTAQNQFIQDINKQDERFDQGFIKGAVVPGIKSVVGAIGQKVEPKKFEPTAESLVPQTKAEEVIAMYMAEKGASDADISVKLQEMRAGAVAGLPGRVKRIAGEQFEKAEQTAQEASEKFASGEYVEGALKTATAGIQAVMSPIYGVVGGVVEPAVEHVGAKFSQQIEQDLKNNLGEQRGGEAFEAGKMATAEAIGKLGEAYESLPSEVKTSTEFGLNLGDALLTFYGGKAIKEGIEAGVIGGVKKIEQGAMQELKMTKQEIGKVGVALEELQKAKQVKNVKKAEKLATEILQPKAKDVKLAKMAGDSTSEPVKEYIKSVEQAVDFDDAVEKLMKQTSDDFTVRNKILEKDNYDVPMEDLIKGLEKHIEDARASKLVSKSKLEGMEEVLQAEKEWWQANMPDRVAAQARKEAIYKEAKPLYDKIERGAAVGNEEGRVKAFEVLGKAYKQAVEGGDEAVRAINASYGGKLGALEMLASRGALADKAISPTLTQKLVAPVVDLLSSAAGAGSAAFVAKQALKTETKLPALTKKLLTLQQKIKKGENKEGLMSFVTKMLKDVAEEQNLPIQKGKLGRVVTDKLDNVIQQVSKRAEQSTSKSEVKLLESILEALDRQVGDRTIKSQSVVKLIERIGKKVEQTTDAKQVKLLENVMELLDEQVPITKSPPLDKGATPKTTIAGYHIPREKGALQQIEKEGFNLKKFGSQSGTKDAGDPKGVYFFPDEESTTQWKSMLKEEGEYYGTVKSILDIKKPFNVKSKSDVDRYFAMVKKATGTKAKNLDEFRNIAGANDSAKVTKYFQKLGYDSIVDKQGLLSFDEPQIIIFNPKQIKINKK